MLLLAFGHKARNGKDTAGEAVQHYYDARSDVYAAHGVRGKVPTVGIFKFATALYEEARTLHGMVEKNAALLQRVGTERRAEDPLYWVKKCFGAIDAAHVDIAVITDLRYQNEAGAVKARRGFTADVMRLNPDGSQYITDDRPADHPSEIELDSYPFDYFFKAYTGEVAWVQEQAITLVEHLRGLESK